MKYNASVQNKDWVSQKNLTKEKIKSQRWDQLVLNHKDAHWTKIISRLNEKDRLKIEDWFIKGWHRSVMPKEVKISIQDYISNRLNGDTIYSSVLLLDIEHDKKKEEWVWWVKILEKFQAWDCFSLEIKKRGWVNCTEEYLSGNIDFKTIKTMINHSSLNFKKNFVLVFDEYAYYLPSREKKIKDSISWFDERKSSLKILKLSEAEDLMGNNSDLENWEALLKENCRFEFDSCSDSVWGFLKLIDEFQLLVSVFSSTSPHSLKKDQLYDIDSLFQKYIEQLMPWNLSLNIRSDWIERLNLKDVESLLKTQSELSDKHWFWILHRISEVQNGKQEIVDWEQLIIEKMKEHVNVGRPDRNWREIVQGISLRWALNWGLRSLSLINPNVKMNAELDQNENIRNAVKNPNLVWFFECFLSCSELIIDHCEPELGQFLGKLKSYKEQSLFENLNLKEIKDPSNQKRRFSL